MYQRVVKRILDFIISIMAMPFILMILLIVTPLIYINDPGPIYYVSKRIGKNGIIFDMYKLRTMKVNSPDLRNSDGSTFNSDSDSRQTEIGRILRKLSIDELPQFFNILKGDMTLIGPRPVLDSQLASFSDEENEKLKVLPGITGYSQAYCRNQMSSHDERMQDAWYANNVCFFLDVKIFFKSIETVLHPERVYKNQS